MVCKIASSNLSKEVDVISPTPVQKMLKIQSPRKYYQLHRCPLPSMHLHSYSTRGYIKDKCRSEVSRDENFALEQKQVFHRFHGQERKRSNKLEI